MDKDISLADRLRLLLSRCEELGEELNAASEAFEEAPLPLDEDIKDQSTDALYEAADCLVDASECVKTALKAILGQEE